MGAADWERMNKPRILVVDDDSKVSNLLAVILRRCGGYEVREENRSYLAVRTAAEFRPKLILLDVDMPGKGGGEVASELAAHPALSTVPVLFVTSLVAAGEAGCSCVKRGPHYFLSKPVRPNLMLQTVWMMLETGAPVPALV
jgi:CheY-like chemotaxis protein